MTFGEAMIFIRGIDRRYRNTLEASRLIVNTVCGVLTGKTSKLKFSWDNEHYDDPEELSEEEFKKLINKLNNREG